jgi:hypothetical protein
MLLQLHRPVVQLLLVLLLHGCLLRLQLGLQLLLPLPPLLAQMLAV